MNFVYKNASYSPNPYKCLLDLKKVPWKTHVTCDTGLPGRLSMGGKWTGVMEDGQHQTQDLTGLLHPV